MARILIVEDERILARNMKDELREEGHDVLLAHTAKDAIAEARVFLPDLIVLDLRLPDGDGLQLLPKLKAESSFTSIIVVTAHGNERIAVEAMKAGATEYLTKPVDMDEMLMLIGRIVEHQQVSENLSYLRNREQESSGLEQIIGESDAILHIKNTIMRLTRTGVLSLPNPPTVLITGETGTGKDLVARAIHYHGPRRGKPFIHVNCGALQPTLFESELFGHLRGAFTSAAEAKKGLFEVANGGTIFLDEIGNLGMDMQAKLLHAIEHREIRPVGGTQYRPVNVHVISATNRDLAAAVDADEFRRDLYHRLRVVTFHQPPLRERGADVLLLAGHFLTLHGRRFGLPPKSFSAEALELLQRHSWRGNVRELSHLIESCILQVESDVIESKDLPIESGAPISIRTSNGRCIDINFNGDHPRLADIEHQILLAAMDHAGQNASRAARLLGITRDALRYRLNMKSAETVRHEGADDEE